MWVVFDCLLYIRAFSNIYRQTVRLIFYTVRQTWCFLCWLTGLLSDNDVIMLTDRPAVRYHGVIVLTDRPAVRQWCHYADWQAFCQTLIMLTDLLLETMMFLCWLFDTKMTDLLSETMMFLCWLTARCHTMMSLMIMMTVWWTCCETLMSLYWLTETVRDHDVFMLTVWQTCCETLMFLYWLFDGSVRDHDVFMLFDRPAYRDCDVFTLTVWQTCCQRLWCQPLSSCWSPWARCARCLTT